MDGGLAGAAAPASAPQQKRDEWTEGGISRLLQAYEAKWLLRNRAKLKWSDWVDIAADVSAHCASAEAGKPPGAAAGAKTPNQCKNKVESMKKRYRAESAAAARAGTSWRFFGRMDGLLKGPAATAGCSNGQVQAEQSNSISCGTDTRAAEIDGDASAQADIPALRQLPDAGPAASALSDPLHAKANGSAATEKADRIMQKEAAADSDAAAAANGGVSSPRSKEEADGGGGAEEEVGDVPSRKRKGSGSELDVARSIELLASSFVRIEQARMEMYRETERMRAEAEIKKGEMELKRTEIMAKTQLQIARLFARRLKECSGGKNGGSSSEVDGRTKKGENVFSPLVLWISGSG